MLEEIDPFPGAYALLLRSSHWRRVQIGQLGTLDLRPGYYLYIGSALGPGGLRARLAHHLGKPARPHWHLDYLVPHTRPAAVWCCYDVIRREHEWAAAVSGLPFTSIPLPRFGASDCRCPSHLFFL
jgi:Uri superfamily endonuclease